VSGDRAVLVRGPEGVRTSRRQHLMLGLHGTLGDNGRARVNHHAWDSAALNAEVIRAGTIRVGDTVVLTPR
jgi:hypothetical protein